MALERSNMDTYYRAKELYVQGNLTESHKLLTNFIESQRGISGNAAAAAELTDAFNTRGHIHYRWVDFDEAILDYSEAIKLDPKFAVAYYNRGQVHYRLGKSPEEDVNPGDRIRPVSIAIKAWPYACTQTTTPRFDSAANQCGVNSPHVLSDRATPN